MGTLFLVILLAQKYCCRSREDKDDSGILLNRFFSPKDDSGMVGSTHCCVFSFCSLVLNLKSKNTQIAITFNHSG